MSILKNCLRSQPRNSPSDIIWARLYFNREFLSKPDDCKNIAKSVTVNKYFSLFCRQTTSYLKNVFNELGDQFSQFDWTKVKLLNFTIFKIFVHKFQSRRKQSDLYLPGLENWRFIQLCLKCLAKLLSSKKKRQNWSILPTQVSLGFYCNLSMKYYGSQKKIFKFRIQKFYSLL